MHQTAPLASFLTAAPLAQGPAQVEVPAPIATRVLDAAALLAGSRQVVIDHEGKLYRLSLTKNNRLILQK
jgi:hemin uptake protein HemP